MSTAEGQVVAHGRNEVQRPPSLLKVAFLGFFATSDLLSLTFIHAYMLIQQSNKAPTFLKDS